MRKRYKWGLWLIAIAILLLLVVLYLKYFLGGNVKQVKVLSEIDSYGYTLDDRDDEPFVSEFENLKKLLNEKEVDDRVYAQILAKLFVIDFYSLDTKINKYDVGSLEYVHPDKVQMFKQKAMDTIYMTLQDNSDGKRKQELPDVKEVTASASETGKYKIGEEEVDSYIVNVSWNYEKDLGYDKEATITFIKVDKKLYVVDYMPKAEEAKEE